MGKGQFDGFRTLCARLALRVVALAVPVFVFVRYGGFLFSVLLPFLAALLLAHLVNPLIRFLQRRFGGTRQIWAVAATALIVTVVSAALSVLAYFGYEQARAFFSDWADYLSAFLMNLQQAIDGIAAQLGLQAAAESGMESGIHWALTKLTEWLSAWEPPVLEGAGSILTVTANVLITIVVFVVASCYMMGDYVRIRFQLDQSLPLGLRSALAKIKTAAASAIGGYFKAQFILSAAVALISLIVLLVLRQSFAVPIAVVIGLVDFIPIFGSGTILAPWAVVLIFTGAYTKSLVLLILTGALFLLRKLAEPRVLGGQTGLPALVSLICIYVGMRLGGVLGMIIAPVLCMMLIDLYRLGMFDGLMQDCRTFSRVITGIMNS